MVRSVAGPAWLEHATLCFEGRCSIHLSYGPWDHILAEDDCPSQNVLKKSSLAGRRDRCAWDKFYSLALMPVRAFKESRRALAAADAHGYYAITAFAAG